ncbi:hypothetical protein EKG38_24755 [Shewanella canadensis]|uniref:Uncharacterized protein n=1 Tax=Shewanella canadensis TaxID=271096 RepID=A0A431WJM2_9GAMM|nr:hypothetical protein [Shewanella canadensis]RTR35480.1 hypothetical protein EKG38_24755 [Shewanella canadensis]
MMFLKKFKIKLSKIDFLLILFLIYQVSYIIEIIINNLIYYNLGIDYIINMSDNSKNTGDIIPRNRENPDYARLIRYLSTNIAALIVIRPINKTIGLTIANAGNILADIVSNEERANYWIEQYNFYLKYGILRGGQYGIGSFERCINPFNNQGNINNSNTSNFMPNFDFIKDFFSPVEHSIPLETLINVHFIMNLGLFMLVISLLLLTVYFYINLFI